MSIDCGLKIDEECEGCAPPPTPPVLSRAPRGGVAMPAFDPSAQFVGDEVSPTEFKPGDNIDVDVEYAASNPDAWWNTAVVVTRKDTGNVYCKTHGMVSHDDDHIVEPLVCGKMPDGEVELTVEIWGHDDYYSSPPAICA